MANSGSITTGSSHNRSITLNWSVASQSVQDNKTTINWSLVGSGSGSGWVESGNFQVKIDGNQVYSSATRIQLYVGTVVASGSYTFTHDNNGNKNFSAYIQAGIYQVAVNVSTSGSWDLPQIARLSSIDSFEVGIGTEAPFTIKYTPRASNFYYKLRLSIPNVIVIEKVNLGQKSASQQTLTTEFSESGLQTLYDNWSPTSETMPIGAVIETYQDSNYATKLGESNELIVNMTLARRMIPIINNVILYDDTTTQSIIGSYVQGLSKLNYEVQAVSTANASIKDYTISVSGVTYASSRYPIGVTDVITQSGSLTVQITVRDSRNRTKSTTRTIDVLAYSKPQITKFVCSRNPSNPTQIICQMKGSITSLNNQNTYNFTLAYADHGSTDYVQIQSYNSLTIDTSKTITLTEDGEYDFLLLAQDRFNEVDRLYPVGQAFKLINFKEDGNGIAFGGFSTNDGFEVKMDAMFKEGIKIWNATDEVYESFTSKTLYTNDSGTTDNITMSETKNNFKELTIFYNYYRSLNESTFYDYSKSITIDASASKFEINELIFSSDRSKIKGGIAQYSISGKNITVTLAGEYEISSNGYAYNSMNAIKITKILGR